VKYFPKASAQRERKEQRRREAMRGGRELEGDGDERR
jgi:hypothetical protein